MIICAAIKVRYANADKTIDAVIPGHRHGAIWDLMATLSLPPRSKREEIEGFIDHQGCFLNRHEAYKHALACGQLPDTVRTYKAAQGETELYSEDLY